MAALLKKRKTMYEAETMATEAIVYPQIPELSVKEVCKQPKDCMIYT